MGRKHEFSASCSHLARQLKVLNSHYLVKLGFQKMKKLNWERIQQGLVAGN